MSAPSENADTPEIKTSVKEGGSIVREAPNS
jgi:hypothetical protein